MNSYCKKNIILFLFCATVCPLYGQWWRTIANAVVRETANTLKEAVDVVVKVALPVPSLVLPPPSQTIDLISSCINNPSACPQAAENYLKQWCGQIRGLQPQALKDIGRDLRSGAQDLKKAPQELEIAKKQLGEDLVVGLDVSLNREVFAQAQDIAKSRADIAQYRQLVAQYGAQVGSFLPDLMNDLTKGLEEADAALKILYDADEYEKAGGAAKEKQYRDALDQLGKNIFAEQAKYEKALAEVAVVQNRLTRAESHLKAVEHFVATNCGPDRPQNRALCKRRASIIPGYKEDIEKLPPRLKQVTAVAEGIKKETDAAINVLKAQSAQIDKQIFDLVSLLALRKGILVDIMNQADVAIAKTKLVTRKLDEQIAELKIKIITLPSRMEKVGDALTRC